MPGNAPGIGGGGGGGAMGTELESLLFVPGNGGATGIEFVNEDENVGVAGADGRGGDANRSTADVGVEGDCLLSAAERGRGGPMVPNSMDTRCLADPPTGASSSSEEESPLEESTTDHSSSSGRRRERPPVA